jgi:transcriptional regulator with XRE-family HTH domain
MRLGKKIETLRKKKNLSLDMLSELTDIPKSTLVGYEAGEDGKISNLKKIADILDTTLDELVSEGGIQVNHCHENQANIQYNFNVNLTLNDKDEMKEILGYLNYKEK